MWDSNCLQVNQFRGARVGIIKLCSPDLTLVSVSRLPATTDLLIRRSCRKQLVMPICLPNWAKWLFPCTKNYKQKLQRPYLYDQAFTVKRLELGTGAMWIRLDYLAGRFSSLWSLSCDVRFPRVEAHINIRDATVSGIRGRQGPEQESGACAWVTRWVADCSADVTIQCAICCGQSHVLE